MVEVADPHVIRSKHKAISALLPYAVRWESRGNSEMFDALLNATRASKGSMWSRVGPYIPMIFNEASPRTIILVSPYVRWHHVGVLGNPVSRWVSAASTVPYTDEVGSSVVDALLRIASIGSLVPHIPIGIWAWLEKRPYLHPEGPGRFWGIKEDVIRQVRALGDTEILESFFLLIWSEWSCPQYRSFQEMQISIREDFSGIGMWYQREGLIERLDHVLGQLARGERYLQQHKPSLREEDIHEAERQYGELKRVLLEVDGEAEDVLTRTPSGFILFILLIPTDIQNPTRPSCALCLSHVRNFTLGTMVLPLPTNRLICTLVPTLFPCTLPIASLQPRFVWTSVHRSDFLMGWWSSRGTVFVLWLISASLSPLLHVLILFHVLILILHADRSDTIHPTPRVSFVHKLDASKTK